MPGSFVSGQELLDLALEGRRAPRVPVGFWFHFLPEAETGDSSSDPGLADRLVEGHRRFVEAFRPDMVKIMSDGFFRHPAAAPLENPAQALEAVQALGPDHPWIADQVEVIRRVAAISPGVRRFYNVFSPATTLRFMIGRDRLLGWLAGDLKPTLRLLGAISETLSTLAGEAVARGGADGLYLSVQNPDLDRVDDRDYQAWFAAGELAILSASRRAGGRDILHVCGYDGVRNRLGFFARYPAAAFSWAVNVEDVSLGEGRRLFGGRTVIGGFPNTPGSILHAGTEAGIKERARRILGEAGRTGVVLGADCTVPSDIDLRRLQWVREAAAEPA
jgi:uroporphyrinogen decarboxylase